ncbi:MAG: RNA polymerase sigma factor [Anaerolineae bacterium]
MVERRRPDAELLRGARGGNEEAWAALVDRYSRMVYAIPLRVGLSPDSSANVFHAVFSRLLSELSSVRDTDTLVAWLLQTTTSEARRLRAGVAFSPHVDALSTIDELPVSDEIVQRWQRQQIVREATEQLPERCRRLLDAVLYTENPPPLSELARRLNIPEGRVSAERALCFEALKEILEAWRFV